MIRGSRDNIDEWTPIFVFARPIYRAVRRGGPVHFTHNIRATWIRIPVVTNSTKFSWTPLGGLRLSSSMVAFTGHDGAEVLEGNPNDPDSQGAVTFISKIIATRSDGVYNTPQRCFDVALMSVSEVTPRFSRRRQSVFWTACSVTGH